MNDEWVDRAANSVAHWAEMSHIAIAEAAGRLGNPSAIYRPRLTVDGNQWCALYGENLQDGVAGFGASPADAMCDFDRNWARALDAPVNRNRAHEVLRAHGFPELNVAKGGIGVSRETKMSAAKPDEKPADVA